MPSPKQYLYDRGHPSSRRSCFFPREKKRAQGKEGSGSTCRSCLPGVPESRWMVRVAPMVKHRRRVWHGWQQNLRPKVCREKRGKESQAGGQKRWSGKSRVVGKESQAGGQKNGATQTLPLLEPQWQPLSCTDVTPEKGSTWKTWCRHRAGAGRQLTYLFMGFVTSKRISATYRVQWVKKGKPTL